MTYLSQSELEHVRALAKASADRIIEEWLAAQKREAATSQSHDLNQAAPILRPGESRTFTAGDPDASAAQPALPPRTWPATLGWLALGIALGWTACAIVRLAGWV